MERWFPRRTSEPKRLASESPRERSSVSAGGEPWNQSGILEKSERANVLA